MNLFQVEQYTNQIIPNIWLPTTDLYQLFNKLYSGNLNILLEKETYKWKTFVFTMKNYDQYQVTIAQFINSLYILISLVLWFFYNKNPKLNLQYAFHHHRKAQERTPTLSTSDQVRSISQSFL